MNYTLSLTILNTYQLKVKMTNEDIQSYATGIITHIKDGIYTFRINGKSPYDWSESSLTNEAFIYFLDKLQEEVKYTHAETFKSMIIKNAKPYYNITTE